MRLNELFGKKNNKILSYDSLLGLEYDKAVRHAEMMATNTQDNFGDASTYEINDSPKFGRGTAITIGKLNTSNNINPPSKQLRKALVGKNGVVVRNNLKMYGIPLYLIDIGGDRMITVAESDLHFEIKA